MRKNCSGVSKRGEEGKEMNKAYMTKLVNKWVSGIQFSGEHWETELQRKSYPTQGR